MARAQSFEAKRTELAALCNEGALFQTRLYVALRFPGNTQSKVGSTTGPFSQFAFLRGKRVQGQSRDQLGHELNDTTLAFRSILESQGFETRNVGGNEVLKLIYRFINPERSRVIEFRDDTSRTIHSLADRLAVTDFLEGPEGLKLGQVPVKVGTLKSLPDSSIPCLAQSLATAPESFAFVLTVLMLPQTSERERLGRKQRLAQGMAGGNRVRNLVAETQLQEIEETLTAMISSGEKLVAASFHLFSIGEADEATHFSSLMNRAEELGPGCVWFEETVGAFPVFFGNLPFAPAFMSRPKRMLTSGLSDLFHSTVCPRVMNRRRLYLRAPTAVHWASLSLKSPPAPMRS